MAEEKITVEEQLLCLSRQIAFQKRVIAIFENESPVEVQRARHELKVLESIKESFKLYEGIEIIMADINSPILEEVNV